MSGPRLKPPTLGQVLAVVQIAQAIANINWKGLKAPMSVIKTIWAGLNLKEYWGRLALGIIASLLIAFVLYDWRRQAVERVEAQAAVVALTLQRDTLLLEKTANDAASTARRELLVQLAEQNKEDIDDLQESVEANGDWASQRTPADVLARLR